MENLENLDKLNQKATKLFEPNLKKLLKLSALLFLILFLFLPFVSDSFAENIYLNFNDYSFLDYGGLQQNSPAIVGLLDNPDTYQYTPTYDGSDQTVHPSIIYFPDAWNGYKYWMVITPYPIANPSYENPSILVSNDGLSWEVPLGLSNPIDPKPSFGINSDPDIVYVNGSLWVYYRWNQGDDEAKLLMRKSIDGITWSDEYEILSFPPLSGWFASQAVIYKDNLFEMWAVDKTTDEVIYFNSTDGMNWQGPYQTTASPSWIKDPWHLDVIWVEEMNEYWILYNGSHYDPENADIYFASSSDGINWQTWPRPIIMHRNSGWDNGEVYKPTFLYNISGDNLLEVWYSARDTHSEFHTGYTSGIFVDKSDLEIECINNQFEILDNGNTLKMWGNNWKAIPVQSSINSNSVLSFYFRSVGAQGEINGVGFDNDMEVSEDLHFRVFGSQDWGIADYADYSGTDWKYYEIPIGDYIAGSFDYLTFSDDADAGQATEIYFKDVKIIEEEPTCTPGWDCKDPSTLAYLTEDCTWINETHCEFGCSVGQCLESPQDNINFNNYLFSSYGGPAQDQDLNNYEILDNGNTLKMWGNNWKAIPVQSSINSNSVLSFYFRSVGAQGEINGIGFDNDLGLSGDLHFKVFGSQDDWGILDHADYSGTDWKYYEIPIGDYFTGSFNYLTFSNDADAGQATEIYFKDVKIIEGEPTCTPGWACKDASTLAYLTENCTWTDETPCEFGCSMGQCLESPQDNINFNNYLFSSYGGPAQDEDLNQYEILDSGNILKMWGNNWKAIPLQSSINSNSVLSFYFRSAGEKGEINGVGFDNNLELSGDLHFRVFGSQDWGIADHADYSGTDWKYYEIPIGDYFTGSFNYLTFSNDADAGQATEIYFKDVKIIE